MKGSPQSSLRGILSRADSACVDWPCMLGKQANIPEHKSQIWSKMGGRALLRRAPLTPRRNQRRLKVRGRCTTCRLEHHGRKQRGAGGAPEIRASARGAACGETLTARRYLRYPVFRAGRTRRRSL